MLSFEMTNAQIAKLLRNVAASYAIKNEAKYRFQIIAYQRAADAIQSSTAEVKDLIKEDKLEGLPGVGPSIRAHLEELIKTGEVKHFEAIMKEVPNAVFPLLDVPTFGPKKAYKLVSHFGFKNPETVIADLKKVAGQGKIAKLEGFGEKSQQDILEAIEDFKEGNKKTKRMVLPYAAELAETILTYLKKSDVIIDAKPLGSLRRRLSTIGDLDFAVSTKDSKKAIDYFIAYPHKERIIEQGDISASILVSSGRQVDLMTQPPDSFGSLLQHFTGSKNHNVHLRELAIKKGMSLSEKGIKIKTKTGEKTEKYATEEAFYKALGMDWLPPEMREDTGEIELSLEHKLPQLIQLKDIKADFHLHSSFHIEPSHDMGISTMEEMVEKARHLGYEYIGFSEHNPSVSKHSQKEVYDILARRKDKIEQINESNKNIRVISLLETDILANGEIAIDEKSLSLLDGTLVSIHSAFNMNREDMTKRIIAGLSHPKAKILSHPTGRLLNQRPGYEVNFDELFDFVKRNTKALEINSWPERLDLPDIMVREAVKNGIKMVINTDSHAKDQMDMMQFGVSVARRGWATKQDILNTLSYNKFMDWLKK